MFELLSMLKRPFNSIFEYYKNRFVFSIYIIIWSHDIIIKC